MRWQLAPGAVVALIALSGCDRLLGLDHQATIADAQADALPACAGDNFDATTIDRTRWQPFNDSGTTLTQDGRLEIGLPAGDPHAYAGVTALAPLGDATGIQVELVQPALVAGAEATLQLRYGSDTASISQDNGTLGVAITSNGTRAVQATRAFDPIRDRFLRITLQSPNLIFATSQDNRQWATLVMAAPPSSTALPYPMIDAGVYASVNAGVMVAFDNYEVVTADCQP